MQILRHSKIAITMGIYTEVPDARARGPPELQRELQLRGVVANLANEARYTCLVLTRLH